MKHKLIITALFFLFTFGAQAQDKYQFMVIEYRISGDPTVFISIDGDEHIKEKVEESKDVMFNVNPLLKNKRIPGHRLGSDEI